MNVLSTDGPGSYKFVINISAITHFLYPPKVAVSIFWGNQPFHNGDEKLSFFL